MYLTKSCCFINSRPIVAISSLGTKKLGRCYYEGKYKITATKMLSVKAIMKLWEGGFLGEGQSFSILSVADGTEKPAGYDLVEPKMVDQDKNILNEKPVNFFGKEVLPKEFPYYEYIVSYRVDSSD